MFVPVRAIPDPAEPAWCAPEHRHEPLAAQPGPGAPLIAVDWRSRLGAWRRELVCPRCLYTFLQERVRDSDTVLAWFPSSAGDALAEPRPLGQLAEWPADMPTAAA